MKNKNEVYVEVRTEKQARKLKCVLDMFKEKYSDIVENILLNKEEDTPLAKYKNATYMSYKQWSLLSSPDDDKTKVSIKELRNILAAEHLKEGDVVLTKSSNDKIIAIVNKTCDSNVALFEAKRWIRIHDGFKWDNKGCFDYFIRYATEEEKALLEPKKELEVINTGKLKVEVDTAPIKEAFEKLGDAINDLTQRESPEQKVVKYAESVDWDFDKVYENLRFETGSCITFKEWDGLTGEWNDDKVRNIFNKYNPHWELKKSHKEGKEIEVYCGGNWHDCDPMWLNHCEYRIKPLYAGDWVMYYSGDIKKYTIITESNLDHFSKRECARVKDSKLIELLNNNK